MMAKTILDAVTTTGQSAAHMTFPGCSDHTVQTTFTGSPTAVTIKLMGSLDANTWFDLAEHVCSAGEISAGAAMFHVNGKLVKYIAINLTVLTGGTSPTLTALYQGEDPRD
jgi:hypothetical protein